MWGATQRELRSFRGLLISIHAPRVGGDILTLASFCICLISIHAPRVGGDRPALALQFPCCYFNPRPPCGGRPAVILLDVVAVLAFQSTPPVWGATPHPQEDLLALVISIHAPRVGGDPACPLWLSIREISIHAPRVGGDGKNS